MLHKSFRVLDDLQAGYATFADAYAVFLQSGHVPPSLEDDIHRLQQHSVSSSEELDTAEVCIYYHSYSCISISKFH